MNCSFCGKELKEDAKFCLFCGTRVHQAQTSQDSMSHQPTGSVSVGNVGVHSSSIGVADSTEKTVKVKEKKKIPKKKLIIALVAAVVAIAILVGVGAFALLSAKESMGTPISAYISAMGDAYICYGDGKYVKVAGNISEAYLTPDLEHVIAVDQSGNVFWSKAGSDKKNVIAKASKGQTVNIVAVCNELFFFTAQTETQTDATSQLYCHSFDNSATKVIVDLNKCDSVAISSSMDFYSGDVGTIAYAIGGTVYVFDTEDMESTQIGTYSTDAEIFVTDVSCEGDAAVWTVSEKKTVTSYIWIDGRITELNKIDANDENSYDTYYSLNCPPDSSDTLVVAAQNSSRLYIKADGSKTLTTVELPAKLASSQVYSAKGTYLSATEDADSKDGFYVPVLENSGNESSIAMYYVSESGKYTSLVTGIKDSYQTYTFSGEKLLYIDTADNAHLAEIHKNRTKVTSNMQIGKNAAQVLSASKGGDFVYVLTNADVNADIYNLSRYDIKKNNSKVIANNVTSTVHVSEDSESVYYFVDKSSTDSRAIVGTLYVYSGNEAKLIEKSVVLTSLTSNLASGDIDSDSMWFEVYVNKGSTTGYIFNIVFYGGKEAKVRIANASKE